MVELMSAFPLAQQGGNGGGGAIAMLLSIVYLGIVVLMIASMWKLFTKAGKPG